MDIGGVGEQTMIRSPRVHDRVPRPGVRPRGRGDQAGPTAADARIDNPSPGHSPPAVHNAPRSLTPPAATGRRWETFSAVCFWRMPADVSSHAPAPTALDRCVPPPIRPRARWCRAGVPMFQQLPAIRPSHFHGSIYTSMTYEWSRSCNSSCCHRSWPAPMTGKRQRR